MCCKCQKCGNEYKLDLMVSDEIWHIISPQKNSGGLLCPVCILIELEKIYGYSMFKLNHCELSILFICNSCGSMFTKKPDTDYCPICKTYNVINLKQ